MNLVVSFYARDPDTECSENYKMSLGDLFSDPQVYIQTSVRGQGVASLVAFRIRCVRARTISYNPFYGVAAGSGVCKFTRSLVTMAKKCSGMEPGPLLGFLDIVSTRYPCTVTSGVFSGGVGSIAVQWYRKYCYGEGMPTPMQTAAVAYLYRGVPDSTEFVAWLVKNRIYIPQTRIRCVEYIGMQMASL